MLDNQPNPQQLLYQLIQPLQMPALLLFNVYYLVSFVWVVGGVVGSVVGSGGVGTVCKAGKSKTSHTNQPLPSDTPVSLVRFTLNDVMYNVKLVNKQVVVVQY